MSTTLRTLLRAAFAATLCAATLSAQSIFIGAGGTEPAPNSGNWGTAAHWLNTTVPTSGDTTALSFGGDGASGYTATNNLGDFTLMSLSLVSESTGMVTLAGSGMLTFAGDSPGIDQSGTGAVTISSNISVGEGIMLNAGAGTGLLTLSGAISGDEESVIYKVGAGTLALTGSSANTLTAIIVAEGTVQLGKTSGYAVDQGLVIGPGATVDLLGTGQLRSSSVAVDTPTLVGISGTLNLNGHATTLVNLNDAGASGGHIATGGATLTVNQEEDGIFLGGSITGTGSLVKTGAGILELTASSTFSGGTTISDGILLVSNATGSALGSGSVFVSGTGALGGEGRINPGAGNHVTLEGRLMPGEYLGNFNALRIGNSVNTNLIVNGGTIEIELCGCGEGDLLTLSGALLLTNAILDIVKLDTLSDSYTVITYNSRTGIFSSVYFDGVLIADPTLPGALNGDYQLVYGATSISIVPSAIPEPATYALLAGLAAFGLVIRRRRAAR